MADVRVNVMGLDRTLSDLRDAPREMGEIVEDALADLWADFSDELTGGSVKRRPPGGTPKTHPGAGFWPQKTTLSIKGWAPKVERRRGASFTLTARNPVDYAAHARKAGQPVGTGRRLVFRSFSRLANEYAEFIADDFADVLDGKARAG
jgi:hypothetical protein